MVADVLRGPRPGVRGVQDPDGLGPDPAATSTRRRTWRWPAGAARPGSGCLDRVRCQPRLLRRHGDPAGRGSRSSGYAHFEEPLPERDMAGLREVCRALDIPVSTGEQLNTAGTSATSSSSPIRTSSSPTSSTPAGSPRSSDLPAGRGPREARHAAQPVGGDPVRREPACVLDDPVGTRPHEYSRRVRPRTGADRRALRGADRVGGRQDPLTDRPGLGLVLDQAVVARLRA